MTRTDPGDAGLPLTAWFLGPRAENASVWAELFDHIFQDYVHWRRNYFPADPWIVGRFRRRSPEHEAWLDSLSTHLDGILSELKFHFPLHSPRYIAHMVSEQSLPAVLGYFAGLLYNPNNVSSEAAPITAQLELEVGRMVAGMLGYHPERAWAHICSGGTLATLEALWVARSVQFGPLIAREYCQARGLRLLLRVPNGGEWPIAEIDDRTLIALRPSDALTLFRAVAQAEQADTGRPLAAVMDDLNAWIADSRFNVARRGLGPVLADANLRPVVLASAAAHYSVAKACNLLGYGEEALRLVPVNPRFQLEPEALRDLLFHLGEREYVAAVIGVLGTTEEGAVDPLHRILELREESERTRNRSFWVHVDAAWGGYVRSLFNGLPVPAVPGEGHLRDTAVEYARALDLREQFPLDVGDGRADVRTITVEWGDPETIAAFLAVAESDSTTVDPHKMGYVPYPAGVVAFRNALVTEFISQRAQYLADEADGVGIREHPVPLTAFGPHILEGSKPGAAALACWLAHKTIPLTTHGHGKIVRTTLQSARRLYRLLLAHPQLFCRLERERGGDPALVPFTFVPITEPETNIVCFVARPEAWREGSTASLDLPLGRLNRLNQRLYRSASLPGAENHHRLSSAQPFFVSRTRFEHGQYRAATLRPLLDRLGVSEADYMAQGLFVLRATVMNPWHGEAAAAGLDYLYEFVKFLHGETAAALRAELG